MPSIASSMRTRQEGEHHALDRARLDRVMPRLALLEHGQETLFELTAHTTRFVMSVSPDIPEMDKADVNASRVGALPAMSSQRWLPSSARAAAFCATSSVRPSNIRLPTTVLEQPPNEHRPSLD